MKKIKLVIIIPCFNEEQSLGQVLTSIPKKIAGVDKIITIVIDDGSQDKTQAVAKKNKANYVLIHKRRQGLAKTFEDGLTKASPPLMKTASPARRPALTGNTFTRFRRSLLLRRSGRHIDWRGRSWQQYVRKGSIGYPSFLTWSSMIRILSRSKWDVRKPIRKV